MQQIPLLFPGDPFVMIPASSLLAEIKKRKKIYNKHRINMRKLNYLNLVAAHDQLSANKPIMQEIKVIENRYLEAEVIFFDRDNMVIITGCLYRFLFWLGGLNGTPMMETIDMCIEHAKSKLIL